MDARVEPAQDEDQDMVANLMRAAAQGSSEDCYCEISASGSAEQLDPGLLLVGLVLAGAAAHAQGSASPAKVSPETQAQIEALEPALEDYVKKGMAAFDVPGTAVGIVAGDRLVYAKGFGVRRKGGNEPVDTKTVFQIGSTTKAFLAATLAIAVDRGKLKWNDRVVELDPTFMLKDPWVTREFRVYDLLAQRSGLPPYADDALAVLGFDAARLMHSLRFVEPRTSFRSTFTYTNITHLFAGRIAARALGAPDWPTLARREIIDPLGMRDTSFTPEAIEQAPDHATGHRWTPKGSVEIPFDFADPYVFGPAGDINSTLDDCARWLRLQLGDGVLDGHRLVSANNLAVTRTPKVAVSETVSYAMGWIITGTRERTRCLAQWRHRRVWRDDRFCAGQAYRRHRLDQPAEPGLPGRRRAVGPGPAARQPGKG